MTGLAQTTANQTSFHLADWPAAVHLVYTIYGVIVSQTGMGESRFRPSAETPLHLMLYRRAHVGAVLHTHSIAGALLSRSAEATGFLTFSGWELLKGLEGIDRHDCEVRLPVFPNSQDITELAAHIEPRLPRTGPCYGFMLAGHGLYVWGKTLVDAKRHLEVFEYLLQCEREVRAYDYRAGA